MAKYLDPFDYVRSRIPRYADIINVVLFYEIYTIGKDADSQNNHKFIHKIDNVIDEVLYADYNWNEHHQKNHLILMPTGNGLGIGFHPSLGNDEILHIVSNLYEKLIINNAIKIRMGIAKGPNTRYLDVNEMNNLFGWGVTTAYRIMSGAREDEILINEDYANELGKIKDVKIQYNEKITIETKYGDKLIAFKLIPA